MWHPEPLPKTHLIFRSLLAHYVEWYGMHGPERYACWLFALRDSRELSVAEIVPTFLLDGTTQWRFANIIDIHTRGRWRQMTHEVWSKVLLPRHATSGLYQPHSPKQRGFETSTLLRRSCSDRLRRRHCKVSVYIRSIRGAFLDA